VIAACVAGDLASVQAALAADPRAHAERDDHLGSTPLILAAHRGFGAICEALLAAGADVEARERASQTTALHWAAEGGQVTVAALLLGADAELEVVDAWYAGTPLTWTAVSRCTSADPIGKRQVADVLVAAGAEADVFASACWGYELEGDLERRLGFVGRGRTALHVGAVDGWDLGRLLAAGASLTAEDAFGAVPGALTSDSRLAVQHASVALAGGSRPEIHDERLLHFAAAEGHLPGPILCAVDGRLPALVSELPSEVTPLWRAVRGHEPAVVDALLEAGADPCFSDPVAGISLLHAAVQAGQGGLIRRLIAAGADPAATDTAHGCTAAEWAGFLERPDLAELMC